jgi:hypothetical protein
MIHRRAFLAGMAAVIARPRGAEAQYVTGASVSGASVSGATLLDGADCGRASGLSRDMP